MAKKHLGDPKKRRRRLGGLRRGIAAIVPEHFGDVFFLFLIAALATGAAFFWLFAWLPSNEIIAPPQHERIPLFRDEELEEIVDILEARTEASTAPVVPPTRDPFK